MEKHSKNEQLLFLMQEAGPTIRHLLMQRFDFGLKSERESAYAELLTLPAVSAWRDKIPNDVTPLTVLGSSDDCFENAFGMLLLFGLKLEDIITPEQHAAYLAYLENATNHDVYGWLARYIVAGYLHIAGDENEIVTQIVASRLNELSQFVAQPSALSSIYVKQLDTKPPKAYASRKIINPELYADGPLNLPLVHDIFMFSHLYPRLSGEQRETVDQIIDFVADPAFQSLDYGYGLIRTPENKWHAMGWSAHMPLFNTPLSVPYFEKGLIFRLALFSRFGRKGVQKWLAHVLSALDQHKNEQGQYLLPSAFLPETPNSYFLNGRHTSLNENRRQKAGRIIESNYYAYLARSALQ